MAWIFVIISGVITLDNLQDGAVVALLIFSVALYNAGYSAGRGARG
jgi:hypothetical protein